MNIPTPTPPTQVNSPPPPPSPPPGLLAKLNTLPTPKIGFLLDALAAQVRLVRANPPAGRQAEIVILEGAFALLRQVHADRLAAVANPAPPPADAVLTSAVSTINSLISGS